MAERILTRPPPPVPGATLYLRAGMFLPPPPYLLCGIDFVSAITGATKLCPRAVISVETDPYGVANASSVVICFPSSIGMILSCILLKSEYTAIGNGFIDC